jgi:hypothetical protein
VKYTVWIVSPDGYPHSPGAFMEVATALRDGLIELGHEAEIITYAPSIGNYGKVIILGANLLLNWPTHLQSDWIIFNLEQMTAGSPWITNHYVDTLKTHPVWDYCQSNIDELAKLGIEAKLCPIGYVPALTKIPDLTHENYFNSSPLDVLFYGSINERRQKVYDELKVRGANVHWAFNVYGDKRDDLIAHAKIVVNLHFYESKLFEIVRCSYLMANSKCIVSETGLDKQLEQPFYDCIAFSEYDGIANRAIELLKSANERSGYCRKAYEVFSHMKQSDYLMPLVGASL